MKAKKKIALFSLVLGYAIHGTTLVYAHSFHHHHHDYYGPSNSEIAAEQGFLAGSTGATAALIFSAAISRKVGAAPEMIRDQAAAYLVSQEDSVLLRSAMDEFRSLLKASGSEVDTLSYDDLVEVYLDQIK